jgi:hypothetical protein
MRRLVLAILSILAMSTTIPAQEWSAVTADLLKSEKTGFGGLCGVVVDHQTGEVFVNLSDRGTFHSTDRGQTWKRVSETQPKGRTETPGCWSLDPTGKTSRMVTALVYGSPISVSDDRAATWKAMDAKSGHVDWCAVDWTDPELRFVLALKHEAGGLLLASRDGGKSFTDVGKGYGTGWVFDNKTAVVAQAKSKEQPVPHLMRTIDGGVTFESCGQFNPVGTNSAQALPKWHDGALYWLVDGGLISTTDKGKTWSKVGEIKEAQYGPVFGRNAKHLFVLTKAGPVESTDGGATWSPPVAPPKEMKGTGGLSWLDYDPQHDTLYLMKMTSDLYRLTRGK